MVSKFKAVGLILTCGLFCPPLFANNNNNNNVNSGLSDKEWDACIKANGGEGNPQAFETCTAKSDARARISSGKDDDKCDEKMTKFAEATSNFGGACGSIGVEGDATECAKKIKDACQKDADLTDGKICPKKGADLKKYQEEAQKVQDEVSTLSQKLGAFDDEAAKLNQELNDKMKELETKETKADVDFNNKQTDMQNKMRQELNQQQRNLMVALQGADDKYDELTSKLKMIPTQRAQARIQIFDQEVANLDVLCHQNALKQVAAERAVILDKISKSQYTVGGLHAMAKRLGLTDEQRDENKALYYQKKCFRDSEYQTRRRFAWKKYQTESRALAIQKDTLERQQSIMLNRRTALQAQADKDKSEAFQTLKSTQDAMVQAHWAEKNSLNSQKQTLTNSVQAKAQAVENKKKLLNDQIAQKNDYLDTKRAFATAAEEAGNGQDYTASDASKIESEFSKSKENGKLAWGKCGCLGKQPSEHCAELGKFLYAATGSGTYDPTNIKLPVDPTDMPPNPVVKSKPWPTEGTTPDPLSPFNNDVQKPYGAYPPGSFERTPTSSQ